jgi:hypothetical protein
MREISPLIHFSCDAFLQQAPTDLRAVVDRIRAQKLANERVLPSSKFADKSSLLTSEKRALLLNRIASLVDENLFGRSEMCEQFAQLLSRSLLHLGLPARVVSGEALYFVSGKQVFKWDHFWVRVDKEVIDGNVDSVFENPMVPNNVKCQAYWGPINQTPVDRKLREKIGWQSTPDNDVDSIWWPELSNWLKEIE